jgi:putative hydroxymethylpyrimidine transport system substrate-binding protein
MLAALAACGSSSSSTNGGDTTPSGTATTTPVAMRDITLLLDWFPNPDQVSLYMAQSKGYFKDVGLNVKLQPPSDPSDVSKLVSTGTVELGVSYQASMPYDLAAGVKVKAVGALIPTSLNTFMATKDSPVKSPADIAGHTVGLSSATGSGQAILATIYKKYNIDPESVRVVNVKTSLVQAMVAGTVDATLEAYRNIEGVQLQMKGLDPLLVTMPELGVPDSDELVIVANSDRLASDTAYQQIVRDFLSALAKGAAAAQATAEESTAVMAPVAKGYDKAELAKMIEATLPLLKNPDGELQMNEAKWEAYNKWMLDNKLIDSAPAVSDMMTTEFIPTS